MTLEKKNFRADARVLHEKASGGELRRKKKNVFFFEFFFDFPKRGLPWKALKLQGIFLASKNRFLSRLSKNEIAVENIGKSKVNIENFEKLKNRGAACGSALFARTDRAPSADGQAIGRVVVQAE